MLKLTPRLILMLILAAQFALGVLYTFTTPLWQGHEQDFYTVARFLVQNGRLPSADDYPDGDAEIRQATQPPLYFLFAAPVMGLFDDGQPVPPGEQPTLICVGDGGSNAPVMAYPITQNYQMPVSGAPLGGYALRLLNVGFGMLGVVFTYLAGRKLFPNRAAVALAAAALLAFEGNMVRLNSTISNDTLLVTLGAANLLLCAQLAARFQWKTMLLLFGCVGLALMTRLGGWALLAFDIPFILLIAANQWRTHGLRHARTLLLGVGVLVLLAAAVLVFNQITYGNLLGRYDSLAGSITARLNNLRLPWVTVQAVFSLTYNAYQEPLQALQPRAIFGTLYGVLVLIGGIGIVWALLRGREQRRSLLIVLGLLGAAVALVVFRNTLAATGTNTTSYNTGLIFAPLRYYAPGLAAAALLLSAGLFALVPERWQLQRLNLPGVVVAGGWLAVSALGGLVLLGQIPASPLVTAESFAAMPDVQQVSAAEPANAPQIAGYTLREQPEAGKAELSLYLTTEQPLSLNYYAEVALDGGGESSLLPCAFLPTDGALPTTLWLPGEMVMAVAEIPYCGAADSPPLNITLRWVGADQNGSIVEAEHPAVELGMLGAGYVPAATCPENLGVIAGGYQLVRFNSPAAVSRGEVYLPSVNWLVLQPSAEAASRRFTLRHDDSETTYTCDGSTAPQYYNVAGWTRGQEVFYDACPFSFPPDAPAGRYVVTAQIDDSSGSPLPASGDAGIEGAEGSVVVGEVMLND